MTQPRARSLAGSTLFLSCVGLFMALSGLSCLKKKLSPVAPADVQPTATATGTAYPHRAYVADPGNNRVVVIEEDASGPVTSFDAYGVDPLSNPVDVDVDKATGDIWIADAGNGRVIGLTESGLRICNVAVSLVKRVAAVSGQGKVWALHGNNGLVDLVSASGIQATANPGITITSAGDVAVDESAGNMGGAWACSYNPSSPCAVWKIGPSASVGPLINSGLGQVQSVAVNPINGSVYVANYQDKEVKVYNSAGVSQAVYYSTGLVLPSAVAVDPRTGYCWVADNSTVRKITPAGVEDVAPISGFSTPYSLAVDPSDGSVWVSDFGNNRVVKLRDDGVQLGEVLGFSNPEGIAVR